MIVGGPAAVWKQADISHVRSAAREAALNVLAGRFWRVNFNPGDGTRYTPTIVPIDNGRRYLVVLDDKHVFKWDGDYLCPDEVQDRVSVRDWDAVVYAEFLSEVVRTFDAQS